MKKVKLLYLIALISMRETSAINTIKSVIAQSHEPTATSDELTSIRNSSPAAISGKQSNNTITETPLIFYAQPQMKIWQLPDTNESIENANKNTIFAHFISMIQQSKLNNETRRNMNMLAFALPILCAESQCVDAYKVVSLGNAIQIADDANASNLVAGIFCDSDLSRQIYATGGRYFDSRAHWQDIIGAISIKMYATNDAVISHVKTIVNQVKANKPLQAIEDLYALMSHISKTNGNSIPADALSIMPEENATFWNSPDYAVTFNKLSAALNLVNAEFVESGNLETAKLSLIMNYILHSAEFTRKELTLNQFLAGSIVLIPLGAAIAGLIGLLILWPIIKNTSGKSVYKTYKKFYDQRQNFTENIVDTIKPENWDVLLHAVLCYMWFGWDNVAACGLPGYILNCTYNAAEPESCLCDPLIRNITNCNIGFHPDSGY